MDYSSGNEIHKLVERYESLLNAGEPFYLEPQDFVDISEYYQRTEKYLDLDECLRIARRLYPDNDDVLISCAYRLKDKQEWIEAIKIIKSLRIQESREVEFFYIELYLARLEPEQAEQLFISSLPIDNKEELYNSYIDIAELLLDYNYSERARKWLLKIPDSYYDYKHCLDLFGESFYQQKEYSTAIIWLNKAIDINPYDLDLWLQLADAQYKSEHFIEVLDACDNILAIDSSNLKAVRLKSYAAVHLKNLELAILLNHALLDAGQHDYVLNMLMGELILSEGMPDKAVEFFKSAFQFCPIDGVERESILLLLIESYIALKQYSKVKELFGYIISITDSKEEVTLKIIELFFLHDERKEIQFYLTTCFKNPNLSHAQVEQVVKQLYAEKCFTEVAKFWKFLLSRSHLISPVLYPIMAKVCRELKKREECINYIQRAKRCLNKEVLSYFFDCYDCKTYEDLLIAIRSDAWFVE